MTVVAQETETSAGEGTWVEHLRRRAMQQGGKRALTFLRDGENEAASLDYAQIDLAARTIATHLQSRMAQGGRVLLLYPSGLDFVVGFFGCLYAGMIAVPAGLPRLNRNLSRLRSLVGDAEPVAALTTGATLQAMQPGLASSGLESLTWIASDKLDDNPEHWREPGLDGGSVAFLQYTSGSTANPKGVMVSHRNLMANHQMLRHAFGQTEDSTIVTWLPLFHDMGLIGNVLQALYLGSDCVLMPPETFLVKPVRWLQAISRYRAHTSGAPNFAYDLCERRVMPEQRSRLDLGGWKVAFNGAEPVRHQTLEKFARAFSSCGFRREALYPCYGLAEATLFVAGSSHSEAFVPAEFCARGLEEGRVVPAGSGGGRWLVGCGHGWLDEQIAIVNPDTTMRCEPGCVGEIWVSGLNVAQGYWNRGSETEHTFRASLKGGVDGGYLRTGDLGFFHDDQLFVAGRLKDLIILAGRNLHPEDIEETVEASHGSIRTGCCAAFQVDVGGEERLAIVVELGRGHRAPDTAAVVHAVCQAVAEEHDIGVHEVVLLNPGGIPKTTSGKIRRQACREGFLAGTLNAWKGQE